jgi:hypothetical protein
MISSAQGSAQQFSVAVRRSAELSRVTQVSGIPPGFRRPPGWAVALLAPLQADWVPGVVVP